MNVICSPSKVLRPVLFQTLGLIFALLKFHFLYKPGNVEQRPAESLLSTIVSARYLLEFYEKKVCLFCFPFMKSITNSKVF